MCICKFTYKPPFNLIKIYYVKIIVSLKTIVAQKPLNFYIRIKYVNFFIPNQESMLLAFFFIMSKNITWYKFNLLYPNRCMSLLQIWISCTGSKANLQSDEVWQLSTIHQVRTLQRVLAERHFRSTTAPARQTRRKPSAASKSTSPPVPFN